VFLKESSTIEQAFGTCEEIAFRHYENFPVASQFIPRAKRKYVAVIYAFARTADDIADEEGFQDDARLRMLSELERKLQDCTSGKASDPLFVALAETMARFDLPAKHFLDLLAAFRKDIEKKRYVTWDELLAYCSLSANPVGKIILRLFGYDGSERLDASDAICTALQLTNFWQDLSIDVKRNRIYLPLEDLRKFDCSVEDVLRHRFHEGFRRLMSQEVEKTVLLFEEGKPLLNSVGRDLRFQLKLIWLGGMRILQKIQRSNYNVFQQRPTISRWDKCYLIVQAIGGIGERSASERPAINNIHRQA
jgi:squalene synthase HpnC